MGTVNIILERASVNMGGRISIFTINRVVSEYTDTYRLRVV